MFDLKGFIYVTGYMIVAILITAVAAFIVFCAVGWISVKFKRVADFLCREEDAE